MANAIPQSAAPFLGSLLLAAGAGSTGPNYTLMLWAAAIVALVGAVVVLPIRKVK
jgi:hypothetical protein